MRAYSRDGDFTRAESLEANPRGGEPRGAALSLMPTEARYRVYAEWRSWYNGCEDTFALEDDAREATESERTEDDASDGAPGDAAGAAPGDRRRVRVRVSLFRIRRLRARDPRTSPRARGVHRDSIVATRRVLRRLSKDNAKPFGRALGKA